MIRGAIRSLFVVAILSGIALAEESPVQVVDKPPPAETQPAPAVQKAKKHKTKHAKARKHHKKTHHAKKPTKAG
jgi:hypothetical protein